MEIILIYEMLVKRIAKKLKKGKLPIFSVICLNILEKIDLNYNANDVTLDYLYSLDSITGFSVKNNNLVISYIINNKSVTTTLAYHDEIEATIKYNDMCKFMDMKSGVR